MMMAENTPNMVFEVMLACMTFEASSFCFAPRACATTTEQPMLKKLKIVIKRSITWLPAPMAPTRCTLTFVTM